MRFLVARSATILQSSLSQMSYLIPRSSATFADSLALLAEISFGGNEQMFEYLTRGKPITVQKSDLTRFTPKIIFMDLNDEI